MAEAAEENKVVDDAAGSESSARLLVGTVVSNKADKTITVHVERRVKHPLYEKVIKRSTRVHAHDESNECNEGDVVAVRECPPMSRLKRFRLERIVERARGA